MSKKRPDGSYSTVWRGISKMVLRPTIRALMKHDWQGQENLPAQGGVIVAVNHLSYADVLAVALFCDQAGRYPTFLAKSSLFKIKVLGPILVKLGQLPVYRGQADAALVLSDAELGVKNGACVLFYPESTVTRDPAMWPMAAKTGVARLALATGAPVIPVAHWGAQDVLPYGTFKPHVLPRKTVRVLAGPPVDLAEFAGLPIDTKIMRAATDKIMADVAGLLGVLRGEDPPTAPYRPAAERRKERAALRLLAEQQATASAEGGGKDLRERPEGEEEDLRERPEGEEEDLRERAEGEPSASEPEGAAASEGGSGRAETSEVRGRDGRAGAESSDGALRKPGGEREEVPQP